MENIFNAPWKLRNEILRWVVLPLNRLAFAVNGISWGKGWRLHGVPILQKHRQSRICFGDRLGLRSSIFSNPLTPNHPVSLCTWQAGASLEIGDDFSMTGGTICAAERILIGDRVTVGANSTIVDSDFHPLDPQTRQLYPQSGKTAPIVIEHDVFIGMNCLVLKGVHIGHGSVIGAGSVVVKNVPSMVVIAGNPARVIRRL